MRKELLSVGLVWQVGSSGLKSIKLPTSLQHEAGNRWFEVLFFIHGVPLKSVKLLTPQHDSWPCSN